MKHDVPQGRVEIVSSSEAAIRPQPFWPSRTRSEWEALLETLSKGWGGAFTNPAKPVLIK